MPKFTGMKMKKKHLQTAVLGGGAHFFIFFSKVPVWLFHFESDIFSSSLHSSPALFFSSVNCFCLYEASVVCPMRTVIPIQIALANQYVAMVLHFSASSLTFVLTSHNHTGSVGCLSAGWWWCNSSDNSSSTSSKGSAE